MTGYVMEDFYQEEIREIVNYAAARYSLILFRRLNSRRTFAGGIAILSALDVL
jgi:hypothetical protein